MSCDRRCFDKDDEMYGHEDCTTCPGADDGRHITRIANIKTTSNPTNTFDGKDLINLLRSWGCKIKRPYTKPRILSPYMKASALVRKNSECVARRDADK